MTPTPVCRHCGKPIEELAFGIWFHRRVGWCPFAEPADQPKEVAQMPNEDVIRELQEKIAELNRNGAIFASEVERLDRQLQQALNENAALTERAHNLRSDVHDICNANLTETLAVAIEQALIASDLEAQIAALGWQKLTPETKWEEGTRIGAWNKASLGGKGFGSSCWYDSDPASLLVSHGYTYYRRLNPPPQE